MIDGTEDDERLEPIDMSAARRSFAASSTASPSSAADVLVASAASKCFDWCKRIANFLDPRGIVFLRPLVQGFCQRMCCS